MQEQAIIRALRRHLTRSPSQENQAFTADAEIISDRGQHQAFTIDDFSAEDCLPFADGESLGWNLVAATISDLLAAGAKPEMMMNSLVAAPWMDETYLHSLSRGIQAALDECGAFMIGGDVGSAGDWRFTGVAIGSYCEGVKAISRQTSEVSGNIMATGLYGDGNLGALGNWPVRFEIRQNESLALAKTDDSYQVACIDTSDGLWSALSTLADQNSDLRLLVNLTSIPYAPYTKNIAIEMDIPPESFLVGSAGEYELVCLAPAAECQRLESAGWYRIGLFSLEGEPGLYYRLSESAPSCRRCDPLPDPRDAESIASYKESLVAYARRHFTDMGDRHDVE